MKRKLIAVAAAVLALGTTAALADNNFAFDDPYWKQAEGTQSVHALPSIKMERNYDLVDNYIP